MPPVLGHGNHRGSAGNGLHTPLVPVHRQRHRRSRPVRIRADSTAGHPHRCRHRLGDGSPAEAIGNWDSSTPIAHTFSPDEWRNYTITVTTTACPAGASGTLVYEPETPGAGLVYGDSNAGCAPSPASPASTSTWPSAPTGASPSIGGTARHLTPSRWTRSSPGRPMTPSNSWPVPGTKSSGFPECRTPTPPTSARRGTATTTSRSSIPTTARSGRQHALRAGRHHRGYRIQ